MPQALRQSTGKKKGAYYLTLQARIEAGQAVDNLNKMLNGIECTPQEERTTLFTINKLLPSMQAIAVQVEHKIAPNREDLVARALSRGINPDILFANHQAMPLITKDKVDTVQDDSGVPHPSDADE